MFVRLLFILLSFSFAKLYAEEITEVARGVESVNYYPADSLIRVMPPRDIALYPKEMRSSYEKYYQGEDFDYTVTKPQKSLMERISAKFHRFLESIFGNIPRNIGVVMTKVLEVLAVVVVALALYFIIYYMVLGNGNIFFGKKNHKVEIKTGNWQENIHEINFSQMILQYEQNHDYRSAVRYQYLYVLKKLTDRKLIEWNSEKTNKDYVTELSHKELKNEFQELSYIFDYVWYGEIAIQKEDYRYFKAKFNDFKI